MRYSLLDKLSCPCCRRSDFRCTEFKPGEDPDSVEDGLLICSCGERYPVIRGVPRLLPSELRHMAAKEHSWFFDRYAELLGDQLQGAVTGTNGGSGREHPSEAKEQTAQSFGYEWNQFSLMASHYEQNFQHYFEGLPPDFFNGKQVLDAGCGMGRHSYYAALKGAQVVGLDLSGAIDAAYRNNRNHKAIQYIQADLYNIPLKPEQFDLVYCLGVLHHLPDPEAGFRSILRYVKPGGTVHIYVYHKLEEVAFWHKGLLAMVTGLRRVTTRMPYPLLKHTCFALACLFYLGLILPAGLLKKLPLLRSLARLVPLHRYAGSPFHAIYKDNFDRFSAPIENRYSLEEVTNWFVKADLTEIHALGGSGWRVCGKKAPKHSRQMETKCAEFAAS